MKFKFFAQIHNLELDSVKNNGKRIPVGPFKGRLTNDPKWIDKEVEIPHLLEQIGKHSISEYHHPGSTYVYVSNRFSNIKTFEEIDSKGLGYTFYLLRSIQGLLHNLWLIKDNNTYIRDGFLIVYSEDDSSVVSFKASLSEMFSFSDLRYEERSKFSDQEIEKAIELSKNDETSFEKEFLESDKQQDYYMESKYPTQDVFYSNSGSTRYNRALYFSIKARLEGVVALKITSYVNSLECLFTTSHSELSHRVSERVALLLGDTPDEKKDLFKKIKKAYNIRSKVVHGASFKADDDTLKIMSKDLDEISRRLLLEHEDLFGLKDNELEDRLQDLIYMDRSIWEQS